MFYISVSSYDYKSVKSAVEQVFLALMRGNKECKIDCVTDVYLKIDNIDDMFLEVYLCDIEGFMISSDKHSMYLTDGSTEKITAICLSMIAEYLQWSLKDTIKYYTKTRGAVC